MKKAEFKANVNNVISYNVANTRDFTGVSSASIAGNALALVEGWEAVLEKMGLEVID